MAIEGIFRDAPDDAFTVEDLADRIYTSSNCAEKKHRVSVLRAAKKVCDRSADWTWYLGQNRGNTLVFFHFYNARSYATARLKSDMFNYYRHKDTRIPEHWRRTSESIRAMIEPGGEYYAHVVEGGAWWRHVELRIADRDGLPADELRAEQEKASHLAQAAMRSLANSLRR